MRDLARVWAKQGGDIIEKVAADDPSRFFAVASTLIPKDVAVTIEQRLPGGLSSDDWQLVLEVMQAIKTAIPAAGDRPPGQVLAYALEALRAHDSKMIDYTENPSELSGKKPA
jgi:hypothetical protein